MEETMEETIRIVERRFEHFPTKFEWRGQLFEIDAIEDCRTEMIGDDHRARYHFTVRCGERIYRLTQDTGLGCWFVRS